MRRCTRYIDYCSDIGPNGIAQGEVWKLAPRSGGTNIAPARGDEAEGAYMGLSLDRLHPSRLAVSTVDRWNHRDTVWLWSDGGAHWTSLRERSSRNLSPAPWLRLDKGGFGGWIAGLAFNPFDGATLAYTTGLTVFRTEHADKADMVWRPWVAGIEDAVTLSLVSPPEGPHLICGIGDTHGFVHDRLDRAPEQAFADPDLPQTNNVDYAGVAHRIMVRSASGYFPNPEGASLGWSEDGGRSWHEMLAPPIMIGSAAPRRIDVDGQAPITVSADGNTFLVSGLVTPATADRGRIWWRPQGLPERTYAIADKVDPLARYAIDYAGARIFVSRDGAKTFKQALAQELRTEIANSRPAAREFQPMAAATPGTVGEL
jgi:xyloglucan-specific exo-beta-1,4-glucanase